MNLKDINLMNDALFKAIMCHKRNRELVVDVLHAITHIEKERLRKATYISGEEIPKRISSQKKQMTDMTVVIENKHRIIIEMNQKKNNNIIEKNTLYAFSAIVETSHKNMDEYPKVILINLDNYNAYQTDKPILKFQLRDSEGHIESEIYESIHIILANVGNKKYNIDKEIERFALFIKSRDIEEKAKEYEGDDKYMACIRTVEELSTDPAFAGYYDLEEAHRQDLRDSYREGIDDGMEKGMRTGIEKGKKEANIETAKNLLKLGSITKEQIAEATNLSIKEVEELKQGME